MEDGKKQDECIPKIPQTDITCNVREELAASYRSAK